MPTSPGTERMLPVARLAMIDGVQDLVLTPATLERLGRLVELTHTAPIDVRTALAADLADVEVLIGSWGCPPLDREVLAKMPRLALVSYAAGTVKTVMSEDLWARGITVTSAAQANAVPVAEFTFAAIVMAAKDVFRIRDRHREVRGRAWIQGVGPAGPVGTRGLKVGIFGASRIGRLVIERLGTLEVEVAVADPFLTEPEAESLGVVAMAPADLYAWADIVSLHAPALPATDQMVDATTLAAMRDGAWLINTARGSLVDATALEAECSTGRLCAFIDTAEPEPVPPDSPLYDLPNVVLTPHIAGSLGNEISRMGDLAVDEIERWVEGRPLEHQVHRRDLETIA